MTHQGKEIRAMIVDGKDVEKTLLNILKASLRHTPIIPDEDADGTISFWMPDAPAPFAKVSKSNAEIYAAGLRVGYLKAMSEA
jgi:hypothetical protein